jgi:putative DNA primase/helicase
MSALLEAALAYAGRGWPVFPCKPGLKVPAGQLAPHGVLDATTDAGTICRWWAQLPGANVAIATGTPGPDVLDIDVKPGGNGFAAFSQVTAAGLIEGRGQLIATRSGGFHVYFTGTTQRNGGLREHAVDFRGAGGYVIAPPSFVQADDHGPAGHFATAEDKDATAALDWHAVVTLLRPPPEFTRPAAPARGPADDSERPGDDYAARTSWPQILAAHGWRQVRDFGNGRACWCRPGKTGPFTSATTREDGGLYVFSTSTPFDAEVPYSKFGAYAVLEHGGDHSAAARALRATGFGSPLPLAIAAAPGQQPADTAEGQDGMPRTQLDWGLRFAATRHWLRHVHAVGWHSWDGRRWRPDDDGETGRVYADMVKEAWPQLAGLPDDDRKKAFRDLLAAERKNFADGALWFAACRPQMAVAPSALDADRMALNCANGTLSLATMTLAGHHPDSLITKVCRGSWVPGLGETRWSKFVAEILPDTEIRAFVQRLMGSALPGRVRDHILPIFTGTGGNGKSTFIEAVTAALGDYAMQADPTLLMASGHDSHPTGQAALQSRRLAVCMETAQGRHLDAPTAKQLTGGDTITARYMRKDFFSFEPSHTILMITNHKPVVNGSDEALWRRLVVIPFEQVFTGNANPDLKEELESEPDAVLSWMIEGWLEYRENGLAIPAEVRAATDAYKADSDAVGRFIDELIYETSQGSEASADIFRAWQQWCVVNGEEPGTQKNFSEEMTTRGYRKNKSHGRNTWKGIMLLTSGNDDRGEGGGWPSV